MTEDADVCSKVSEAVKIAGFLDKKGSMLWKKYWFVLEERLLLYYRSQLEYLNLSPCRGSVNMALVSSIQPRRNSREPVIHIVSRSSTLILKAKDRETQTKWLQSLLESMGRGPSPFRLSLDNLPAQIHSLPRCKRTGSLDVVWKQPSTPGANAPGTEDEDIEPKTSDSRSSTLGRIRTVLTRRNTADSRELPKRHRESFLRKFMGKSKSKPERDKEELESEEDPHYDTIRSNENTQTVLQEILPGGALLELKDRLASMEKTKKEDPPELPPRIVSGSSTQFLTYDADVSDESDLSGHYQKIHSGAPKKESNEEEVTDSDLSDHYQKIRSNKSKNNKETENVEKKEVDINALYSLPKSKSSHALNSGESIKSALTVNQENQEHINALYSLPKSKSSQALNSVESTSSTSTVNQETKDIVRVKSSVLTDKLHDMTKEGIEQLILELKEIETERLKALQEAENAKIRNESIEKASNDVLVIEIKHAPENGETDMENGQFIEKGESSEDLTTEKKLAEKTKGDMKEDTDYEEEDLHNDEDKVIRRNRKEKLVEVEQELTDLNSLLQRLAEINVEPLNSERGETQKSEIHLVPCTKNDEPDYDIPRPHNTVASRASSETDRLPPTEFFSKADDDSSSFSSSSVEPDSLEAKKEILEACLED